MVEEEEESQVNSTKAVLAATSALLELFPAVANGNQENGCDVSTGGRSRAYLTLLSATVGEYNVLKLHMCNIMLLFNSWGK